jgi:hypothetical protein
MVSDAKSSLDSIRLELRACEGLFIGEIKGSFTMS